jgi:hypothetical protein
MRKHHHNLWGAVLIKAVHDVQLPEVYSHF